MLQTRSVKVSPGGRKQVEATAEATVAMELIVKMAWEENTTLNSNHTAFYLAAQSNVWTETQAQGTSGVATQDQVAGKSGSTPQA